MTTVDDAKVKEGVPVAVYPRGFAVLLIRRQGELFAIANRCVHMGCPLEEGGLDGYTLTCPCPDWRFDIRDGRFVEAPELAIPTYAVRIEGDDVLVQLPGA